MPGTPEGAKFGEPRLLSTLSAAVHEPAERIVQAVFAAADQFSPEPEDDRTVLVMRV